MWLGIRAGSYRRAAKVPHPSVHVSTETIAKASSAQEKRAMYLFNCAQRAHHNVLENYSTVLSAMLIGGLKYPVSAASLGAVWVLGRIVYAFGYTSTSPKNVDGSGRFFNGGFHLAAVSHVALVLLVGKMGLDWLTF